MIHLLDVNLLVALAWPSHVHHTVAHAWFAEAATAGWATCPLTESGFVRVSSNQRVIPEARAPQEALALLRRIVEMPGHCFWSDDVSVASAREVARERIHGYRQVSDAHLLAVALRHGGALATFDRGIRYLTPAGFDAERVVVILL